MRRRSAALLVTAALTTGGCSTGSEPTAGAPPSTTPPASSSAPAPPPEPDPQPDPEPDPQLEPEPEPLARIDADDVRLATAVEAIDVLAGQIGPRPGHTPAYFRAALWVERRLTTFGWSVERQRFPTPAGTSWGVPVDGGPSVNLVATLGDLRPGEPWLIVGAHLDTVPQAPGAEDNASGIGVLLTVAEAAAVRRTRLPVVLVAFGSEEPRGPTDDDHHYGSRAYVESLTDQQRGSLEAMVSLDRVGVGPAVPVGSAAEPNDLTDQLQAAARRAGVPTTIDAFQQSSDHWSFVRDGLPGARLGSTPYAGYHDESDLPAVVEPAQLERTARLVAAWLR